jgi:uncharacterized membrane protein
VARKPSPKQTVKAPPVSPSPSAIQGLSAQFQGVALQQQYSGPIPPPDMMARYAPEIREVILRMAEEEQSQRNTRLNKALEADVEDRRMLRKIESRGQLYGFAIGIAGLIATVVMAFKDQALAASVIGAVDLVALVSVFVTGRLANRERPQNEVKKS